jgi:hypothetical protein
VDLKGWGYANCDVRAYIAAIEIMQNYYPERLGKALMIHVPYLFMKAWNMVQPFIDANTKDKVCTSTNRCQKLIYILKIDLVPCSYVLLIILFSVAVCMMQFVFIDDKNLEETLKRELEDSQIPEMYGGKLTPVPLS